MSQARGHTDWHDRAADTPVALGHPGGPRAAAAAAGVGLWALS